MERENGDRKREGESEREKNQFDGIRIKEGIEGRERRETQVLERGEENDL